MKRLITICFMVILCSGCSTLFTDSSQRITFVSKPEGAHIEVGPYECTTPCSMLIPRKTNYAVKATYEGKQKIVPFEKTIFVDKRVRDFCFEWLEGWISNCYLIYKTKRKKKVFFCHNCEKDVITTISSDEEPHYICDECGESILEEFNK